jgi:hypothetical protein
MSRGRTVTAMTGAALAALFAAVPLAAATAAPTSEALTLRAPFSTATGPETRPGSTTNATSPPTTSQLTDPFAPVVNAQSLATTTTAATPGSSVPGSNGGTPTTVTPGTGDGRLAFTGASSVETWLVLGALAMIALGLALRPRRRPFPNRT